MSKYGHVLAPLKNCAHLYIHLYPYPQKHPPKETRPPRPPGLPPPSFSARNSSAGAQCEHPLGMAPKEKPKARTSAALDHRSGPKLYKWADSAAAPAEEVPALPSLGRGAGQFEPPKLDRAAPQLEPPSWTEVLSSFTLPI
eukprot:scaffold8089_cov93-Isochrysis_galbana.AAC.2